MATLDVHLVTPEREVWSGPAQRGVALGVVGDVGILPGHAPMLIRLAVSPLRIQHEDGHWEVPVVDGVGDGRRHGRQGGPGPDTGESEGRDDQQV